MARDADGRPQPETRGRRSKSQQLRDRSEQMRSLASLFDSMPKFVRTLGLTAILGWLTWETRCQVDIHEKGAGYVVGEKSVENFYRGKKAGDVHFRHPAKGGPFVMTNVLLVLNVPSSGLAELAEDTFIMVLFHDFYDNYLFKEERWSQPKAIWSDMGEPEPYAYETVEDRPMPPGERGLSVRKVTHYRVDIDAWVEKKRILKFVSSLAFAGIFILLLQRTMPGQGAEL